MTIQQLITEHLDIWTASDTEKKSGRGRSSGNAGSVYGIKKLRELILELAVRGKLVPQDANDEPAGELLNKIDTGKLKSIKLQLDINDQEKPFELPRGWEWVNFGSVSEIERGGSPRPIKSFFTTDEDGLNWIKIGDTDQGGKYITSTNEKIKKEGLSKTRMVYPGDFLLTNSMSFGRPYITKIEGCIHDGWLRISPPEALDKDYLYNLLSSPYVRSVFIAAAAGAVVMNLNADKVRDLLIPVPPIIEQNRIVAKVDELMALCDQIENQHNNAAEAHEKLVTHLLGTLTQPQNAEDFNTQWQRISEHFDTLFTTEASIDVLKKILLQLAVMGKLVPQDPNDEPASELLKRIQAEKAKLIAEGKIKKDIPLAPITEEEKRFDIPQNWEWVKPEEFSIKITDGEHFRPPTEENGVYFLSAKDVREEGVSLDDPLFISEETAKKALQRCNPEYGDLLIVSRGATVGRMCKVNIHEKFCLLGSVILVKPTALVLSDYLSISLKSPSSFSLLINASGSTAQPAIYLKDLKEITLSLPPIEEQHRIVAKVDELMAICDQLKSSLTEANQLQQKLADVVIEQAVN